MSVTMFGWLTAAMRRAGRLHPPVYGQFAAWVVLVIAGYTQLLAAHATFVGVTLDGTVLTPTAKDHVYPTFVPLAGAQRYEPVTLLSHLPFELLHAQWLYVGCLAAYFVFGTLWLLQLGLRWAPPLAALFYTITLSLFWEHAALIAEWWNIVNIVLIIFAAWYSMYAREITAALRAGEFWQRPLFPAWVHGLCIFVVAWFFTQAGWRKFAVSGWDWTDGTSLQLSIHWARAKFGPTPFAALQELLMSQRPLAQALATTTLLLECSALVGALPLLFPRLLPLRWLYGLGLSGFFFGVFTLFGSWYFESLFVMVALFMWPFDRWIPRWVAARAQRRRPVRVALDDSALGRLKRGLISRFDFSGRYQLK